MTYKCGLDLKVVVSLLAGCVLATLIYVGRYSERTVVVKDQAQKQDFLKALTAYKNTHNDTSIGAQDFMKSWNTLRENFVQELSNLLEKHVEENDPRLLQLIRKYLFPPDTGRVEKLSFYMPATIQEKTALKYFNKKKNGFFVECGGFDGERSSNTIELERLGWQGLLIEADPHFFFQSLGKNRKAWKLNAALAPTNKSSLITFAESRGGGGGLRSGGKMRVPSFPLNTIMEAMERNTIDFFSLDVEGLETRILRAQPYDKLHICALTMEYDHDPEKPPEIIKMMEQKGFSFHKKIDFVDVKIVHYSHDLFFVNKNGCKT